MEKKKNYIVNYLMEYRMLTNAKYRLITNILIPVVCVLLPLILNAVAPFILETGILFLYYIFMICEVMGDYYCFGCMCKKNAFGMDFLKTGYNGIKYFEDAVLVDILIRPIRIGISILIAAIPFIKMGVGMWSVFDVIIISAIVSVGALNVTRYIGMAQYVYMVSFIVLLPGFAGVVAVLIYGEMYKFIAPILAVVLIAVIAATYYHMAVRIRKSYSDY